MNEDVISKRKAIIFGWDTFRKKKSVFVLLSMMLIALVYFTPNMTDPLIVIIKAGHISISFVLIGLLWLIVSVLKVTVKACIINVCIKYCKEKSIGYDSWIFPVRTLYYYIVGSIINWLILFMLSIIPGIFLFLWLIRTNIYSMYMYHMAYSHHIYVGTFMIVVPLVIIISAVPAIYLGIRICFYGFVILDKGYGPISALKYSYSITRKQVLGLLKLLIILLLLNIGGAICMLIGLIITVPVSLLVLTYYYKALDGKCVS